MAAVGSQNLKEKEVGHQASLVDSTATRASVLSCLVASADPGQRRILEESAGRSGWHTIVCESAAEAERHLAEICCQLAFVDLKGPEGEEFRNLAAVLAGTPNLLLVVCGNEGSGQEEIWARSLGAWFYLPGLRESASLSLLCRDARTISQQQHESSGSRSGHRSTAGGTKNRIRYTR